MNRATLVALAVTLAALGPALASAQLSIEPVRGYAGEWVIDGRTGAQLWSAERTRPLALTTVYDNLDSPENFAISALNTGPAVWGDSVITTGTGTIRSLSFTLYNGPRSIYSIGTPQLLLRFRDPANDQVLATAAYNPNLSPAVPPGYYGILTVSNPPVPLTLETRTLVIEQEMTIDDANVVEFGVVSFAPPTVGSSPASMYTSLGTQWGDAGFITIPGYACNPGYRLILDTVDAATATSWGRVKSLYR